MPPQFLVRLWRVILSSSTLSQSRLTLHVAADLALAHRLALRDHFGATPVAEVADPLRAVNANPGDIAAIAAASPWAAALADGQARVITALPIAGHGAPELLVFGHAEAQASGDDVTVVLSKTPAASALWRLRSGEWHVAGLAGFLQPADLPGRTIAGRYPAPLALEASP